MIVCPDKEASVYRRTVVGSSKEAFSKIKAILKKTAARTREALIEAIGRTLEAVVRQDAWGWFAHCGYVDGDQPS
jgi:hypothetical protein